MTKAQIKLLLTKNKVKTENVEINSNSNTFLKRHLTTRVKTRLYAYSCFYLQKPSKLRT